MPTVRQSQVSSAVTLLIKQESQPSLAGLDIKSTQIGLINNTGADIVIPAGSTLYATMMSNRRGEDGSITARCVDVRVWSGDSKAKVEVTEADTPF
jgi:hypothetical protein